MNSLGTIFGWVAQNLEARLETLRGLNLGNEKENYLTVQSMVQYEIDNDIFKNIATSREISGCINILLLHKVIPLVVLLMEGILRKM